MIKFGIVGMGIRGKIYYRTIKQNKYAEVVAVADSKKEALDSLEGIEKINYYSDFKDMLNEETLDALIIATPDHLHFSAVMVAAEKGIHVMVEKPFATDLKEAELMHEAIQKSGIKCQVAFENRWNPVFVNAKNAISNQDLGDLITINSRINNSITVPTQMINWSTEGSPGWFLFPHSIDMAYWLKGKKPISVYAVGTKKKLHKQGIDTYDSIQSIVNFEDDTHAVFTTSWILPESLPNIVDYKFEIIGEEGALYIDTHDQMIKQVGEMYKHVPTIGATIDNNLLAPPSLMLHSFIKSLKDDENIEANESVGLLNTRIIDAIHKSIVNKKEVMIQE